MGPLQRGGEVVLTAATRDKGTTFFLAVGKVPPSQWTDAGGPAAQRLGRLEQSMGGTVFTLFDFGMDPALGPGHMEYTHRLPHALVYYDTNVMGRIPNAMTIAIPRCSNYNTSFGNFVRTASQVGFAVKSKSKRLAIAAEEEQEMNKLELDRKKVEDEASSTRGSGDDPYALMSGIVPGTEGGGVGDGGHSVSLRATMVPESMYVFGLTDQQPSNLQAVAKGKSKSKMKGVPMRKAIEPRVDGMDVLDGGVWTSGEGPKGPLEEEELASVSPRIHLLRRAQCPKGGVWYIDLQLDLRLALACSTNSIMSSSIH